MDCINGLINAPLKNFLSINTKILISIQKLGIFTLRDIIFYKPIYWQKISITPELHSLKEGDFIQTKVIIKNIVLPKKLNQPIQIISANSTGTVKIILFYKNNNFITNKLKVNKSIIVKGKIIMKQMIPQMMNPKIIFDNNILFKKIEAIYPLTSGITNSQLSNYILKSIIFFEKSYPKFFCDKPEILKYFKKLSTLIRILHFYNKEHINYDLIYERCLTKLAKMELIAKQLTLQKQNNFLYKAKIGNSFLKDKIVQNTILKNLNFKLTEGQKAVIQEIEEDQQLLTPMYRLLQGDVGSGKTIVALLTMINVVQHNFQSALMAPTDLLAKQHFDFFRIAFKNTNITIEILTSKISKSQKEKILFKIQNNEVNILIGTHAIIEETLIFKKLGYIIIDEQHKFGVQQILKLINKGSNPDILLMSATPIPRTVALIIFGNIKISQIFTKPANRIPILTTVMPKNKINNLIHLLSKKLEKKEKIYWICSRINSKQLSDNTELTDTTSRFHSIEKLYPKITSMIHGKMKDQQIMQTIEKFKNQNINILISTTLIEVGIDIPFATLIVIENAEQFGLTQLHQLRGRIGRNEIQSHCILIYDPDKLTNIGRKRLKIIKNTNDGFFIAEQDLILRGEGEILGTKQSGENDFFFLDLSKHSKLFLEKEPILNNNFLIEIQMMLFNKQMMAYKPDSV